jgi:hypothetical protein
MTSFWLRFCGAAVLSLPLLALPSAHAQFSWVDEHGTHVFSDQPPPPGTPPQRILKAPRPRSPYAVDAPAPAPAPAADKPAAPTLADREADYKKQLKQRSEEAAKAEHQAEEARARDERCKALRSEMAGLKTDMRVFNVTPNGDRSYLSDEERARNIRKTQQSLDNDCR